MECLGMFLRNAVWRVGLIGGSLVQANAASLTTRVLQPFIDRHELAGAVTLVATGGKVLSLEAAGYADIGSKKPMTTDAVFWIASMSKPIAATALMLLVDEGRVGLDDPVEKYLPGFSPQIMRANSDETHVALEPPRQPITVRQLLNHTNGIPNILPIETTLDHLPLALRVQSYSLAPLAFEPGTEYAYSTAGINTAGRIVEVVSGVDYAAFLQRRLFDPLQMRDTTFWPDEAQVARLAKAYQPSDTGVDLVETSIRYLRSPLSDREHRYAVPGGGLFSTASDLAKFCQMFLNDGNVGQRRILSHAALAEMTRRQESIEIWEAAKQKIAPGNLSPNGYDGMGLGWGTRASGAYGHGGAYSTAMLIDRPHGLILIWLVQHNGFPGNGGKSRAAFETAAMESYKASAR